MPSKKHVLVILAVLCLFGSVMQPRHAIAGGVAGEPWVFGSGALGIGNYGPALYPERPIGIDNTISGGLGVSRSAVLLSDGSVWVCGDNFFGELGDGTSADTTIFVPVPGLGNVVKLAVGGESYAAVKSDGTVWVWGGLWKSTWGGGGYRVSITQPAKIEGFDNAVAVSANLALTGPYPEGKILALKSDGTVWSTVFGDTPLPVFVQVEGLRNIVAITQGYNHCMALDSEGKVWTWGRNDWGQLGIGSRKNRSRPIRVKGLRDVSAIAAGFEYSVASKSNGTLWTWGANYFGQLGTKGKKFSTEPAKVHGTGHVVAIAAGWYATHFVTKDGSLWSFGSNYLGGFGDGTNEDSNRPVKAEGLENVKAIFTGYGSVLAITAPPQAAAK